MLSRFQLQVTAMVMAMVTEMEMETVEPPALPLVDALSASG